MASTVADDAAGAQQQQQQQQLMAQQMMMLQQQLLQQQMQQALLNQQMAATAQQRRPVRPLQAQNVADEVANAPSPTPDADEDADGAPLRTDQPAGDAAGDQQPTGLMTQEDMEAAALANMQAAMGFVAGQGVQNVSAQQPPRRGKRPVGGELRGPAGGGRAGGGGGGPKWKVTRVLEVKVWQSNAKGRGTGGNCIFYSSNQQRLNHRFNNHMALLKHFQKVPGLERILAGQDSQGQPNPTVGFKVLGDEKI